MSDLVDTGFDDVAAGNVYRADDPPVPSDGAIYAAVSKRDTPDEEQAELDAVIAGVTATVTNPGLSAAGIQAAKALVALPALDYPTLARLAREVAMDIKERQAILKEFKLTQAQYDFLETYNDFYRSALAAHCKDWHAPLSTQERIKVEAAAILEDSLLGLGVRMQNKGEGLPGVIEAAKLFAKIAGVGERETGQSAPGERFTINIDLGGDQKIIVGSTPAPTGPAQLDLVRQVSTDGET